MANSVPGPVQNSPTPSAPFGMPAGGGVPESGVSEQDTFSQYASQQPSPNSAVQEGMVVPQNNNDAPITTVPTNADDSDLIEKEWVEKAKAIVEKTRRDPFQKSQELNKFKAEYLQKRYGKNVGSDGLET
jgi:hypothetical protein